MILTLLNIQLGCTNFLPYFSIFAAKESKCWETWKVTNCSSRLFLLKSNPKHLVAYWVTSQFVLQESSFFWNVYCMNKLYDFKKILLFRCKRSKFWDTHKTTKCSLGMSLSNLGMPDLPMCKERIKYTVATCCHKMAADQGWAIALLLFCSFALLLFRSFAFLLFALSLF